MTWVSATDTDREYFTKQPKERVQFYDHETLQLINSQKSKAMKFVEKGCIQYSPSLKAFLCLHIDGYNVRDYVIRPFKDAWGEGQFSCNCQFYQRVCKQGDSPIGICSHIRATYYYLRSRATAGKSNGAAESLHAAPDDNGGKK